MLMVSGELIQAIRKQYALSWRGIHGAIHWARVMENGLRLAESTGANQEIVKLFSVFHDACRWNDDHDPQHGPRGAALAEAFRGEYFQLDDAGLEILKTACALHTTGRNHPDITVQTCWDADRLDLGRVGIEPDPRFLCTSVAKHAAMIEWASQRAVRGFTPRFAAEQWDCRLEDYFA